MAISLTIQEYLDDRYLPYDVLTHAKTLSSAATAHVSAIPEDNLAKGVLLRRKDGYLLAVIPASHHVRLDMLGEWLKQPIGLATEDEAAAIFSDCERGAVPPLAEAYGLKAVMDESLEGFSDIYFEGGDHCTLVHQSGPAFHRLMARVPHARFSERDH
jgi:Ala-tRNA(Pro) deacylase